MIEKSISRKKFFQTCASILAGGSIAAISGVLLHRNITADEALKRNDCPFPNEMACKGCRAECSLKGKSLSRI